MAPPFSESAQPQEQKLASSAQHSQGDDPDTLAARLAEEMAERWFKGERPLVEDYLNRHSQLWNYPEAAAQLVYEEIRLRQEYIPNSDPSEVVQRFPQWRTQLEILIDCHRLLDPGPTKPCFPEVGESLGDFRMVAELGRGAVGRVFLAAQLSLSERPVVLKLSPSTARDHQEHLSLARLQHSYIVPLYLAQDFPERSVRLLCMPYFGGTTLDRLQERMRDKPVTDRTGKDLLAALDELQPAAAAKTAPRGPARQKLAESSYVDALCILGVCLADALQHAHKRELVHLDIKPANVLLAADGQPMLLDFHLAQAPVRPGAPSPKRLGGTALYMSPEQEKALSAIRGQQAIPAAVDGRSDVYSLGLVLYQALGGPLPVNIRAPSQLRRHNPQVSPGLEDIIQKCMRPDPNDRYADAAALAADLDRHLTNLPLKGVANRSLPELWSKWRQRRPYALLVAASLLILLAVSVLGGKLCYQRFQEAKTSLAEGTSYCQGGEYKQAVDTLGHAGRLAASLPFTGSLAEEINRELHSAQRQWDSANHSQAAQTFHTLVDEIRFRSSAESPSAAELQYLADNCSKFWNIRRQILSHAQKVAGPDDRTPGNSDQLLTDLRDVGIILAALCLRRGRRSTIDDARREALGVLAEAEELCGPSQTLLRERQGHAQALGLANVAEAARRKADSSPPRTAWDHSELGRFFLRAGKLDQAVSEFDRALEQEPSGFWHHYYQGVSAYRQKKNDAALSAFRICVALRPDAAWCFYNRALAYEALGQGEQAVKDYGRALQIDPQLASAHVNRGVLHSRAGRHAEALADFEQALQKGADKTVMQNNIDSLRRAHKLNRN